MKRLETEWQEQPLFQITLSNDQMQVDVLNFGAVLQRISWAIVGRYANRINQAQAMIDGVSYKFDANNGVHCLHGGRETLGLRAFDVLEHSGSHAVLLQRLGLIFAPKPMRPRCAISQAIPISISQARGQSQIITYRWPHQRFCMWMKRVFPAEPK